MGKTYLQAQKEAGKQPKESILPSNGPEGENKMQPGTRPGQRRGNNLDRNDPQSLISGTNQPPAKAAHGQSKTHQVREKATGAVTDVSQTDWKNKTLYPRDRFERVDGVDDETTTPVK